MRVRHVGAEIILECTDLFTLKPNVQKSPKNRADIYIPYYSATGLGNDITSIRGMAL